MLNKSGKAVKSRSKKEGNIELLLAPLYVYKTNLLTKCHFGNNPRRFGCTFAAALGVLEPLSKNLVLKLAKETDKFLYMLTGWIVFHTFASGVQNMGERVCP